MNLPLVRDAVMAALALRVFGGDVRIALRRLAAASVQAGASELVRRHEHQPTPRREGSK